MVVTNATSYSAIVCLEKNEDYEYESNEENKYEEEEEDLEERIYNYFKIEEEDLHHSSAAVCPRPDPFENLEYYTSLIRSQLEGSSTLSSTQVISDSSVQKEQFKINNITSPTIPSNYKQKIIPVSSFHYLFPLVCYVPKSFSLFSENVLPTGEGNPIANNSTI
ncbi:hypothetical protein F8M41_005308 [Gigaspora margarita]|uniref:Uncharacterized protein n=1 Tax=Gigaspora margarita TaxID=4874 RepID=A0A8H4AXB5_GIGMA|nr:hypothetical protein F8M41_005308 [Gigaspora margarita]